MKFSGSFLHTINYVIDCKCSQRCALWPPPPRGTRTFGCCDVFIMALDHKSSCSQQGLFFFARTPGRLLQCSSVSASLRPPSLRIVCTTPEIWHGCMRVRASTISASRSSAVHPLGSSLHQNCEMTNARICVAALLSVCAR